MWSALLLVALAAPDAPAAPEAPPDVSLSSDRPGFSFAAGLVPPLRWDTEIGVSAALGNGSSVTLPVMSARLGLTEHLELQLGLPNYTWANEGPDGLSNLAVGVKIGHAPRDWVAYSLVALAVAPTGDKAVADTSWQGLLAYNLEMYFGPGGNAWTSLNAQLDTFTNPDGERSLALTPSAALGWTFAGAVNPFVQSYVRFASGEASPFVGAGVAWLVTREVQVDLSADYDVDGEQVLLSTGFSVLY